MRTISCIFILGVILTASGCGALPQAIELTDDRQQIKSESITVTIQETPSFQLVTPKQAILNGTIAMWVDVDTGPSWEDVTEGNNVPDFTTVTRDKFVSKAQGQYGYSFVKASDKEPQIDSADYARLSTQFDTAYILELRTKMGLFGYGPLSWQTMFLNYFADATLVRRSDGAPVWRATCKVKDSESDLLAVPSDDVFDGSGEDFRAAADYATSSCSDQLLEAFVN